MAPSRVRIPPSPLAQRPPRFCAHPRRGGRAVECGGLENRYPSLGGSRVQISPPPLRLFQELTQKVGSVLGRAEKSPASAGHAASPSTTPSTWLPYLPARAPTGWNERRSAGTGGLRWSLRCSRSR